MGAGREKIKNSGYRKLYPISPAAPYLGGKRLLAKTIVPIIDSTLHKSYAEPFVGMGGIFLRRQHIPHAEVINDLNRDISNLFRVLQRHYTAFLDMLRFQLTTRAEFERLCMTPPETLTDLENAARFIFLQKTAFGGHVHRQTFGVAPARSARFDVTKLGPVLEDLHTRIAGVVIENLPYQSFIERYDTKDTLFYIDPPYWGCEDQYGKDMFSSSDFENLAQVLGKIKGKFLLSLNDVPQIRKTFKRFNIKQVSTTYSVAEKSAKSAQELLIRNFG